MIYKFVEFLTSGYEKLGILEVRVLEKGKIVERRFFYNKDECISFIEKNKDKDVLLSLNPRDSEGGREENVKHGNTFFIDLDARKDGKRVEITDEKAREIRDFLIENFLWPSMIVKSGYGLHLYYKLSKPVDRDKWIAIEQGLIDWFKKNLKDYVVDNVSIAQCVRVAGTTNTKYNRIVEIFDESWNEYSEDDFANVKKEVQHVKHVVAYSGSKKLPKSKIAKIVRLFDGFWVEGHRQNLTLCLSGALRKKGYKFEDAYALIRSIVETYKDEEKRTRLHTVKRDYDTDNEKIGVSGLEKEFFVIGEELGYSRAKVLLRLFKILKVLGIKSKYIYTLIEEDLKNGIYDPIYDRFVGGIQDPEALAFLYVKTKSDKTRFKINMLYLDFGMGKRKVFDKAKEKFSR